MDEFLVGGFDENQLGRSNASKQLGVLVVKKVEDKKSKQTIGRAYVKVIQSASADNLKTFFEEKISSDCSVKGYLPLKKIGK